MTTQRYGIKIKGVNGGTYILTGFGFLPEVYSKLLKNKYKPKTWKTIKGAQRNVAANSTDNRVAEVFALTTENGS